MKHWIGRCLLAGWFVGMVVVAVLNQQGVGAQEGGKQTLYLPMMHNEYDMGLRQYVGLVHTSKGYYTVRGDNSDWMPLGHAAALGNGAWSPDGASLAYTFDDQVWIVPLATREPQYIGAGHVGELRWSPDSQHLAYYTPDSMNVYSLQSATLSSVPHEGEIVHLVWSPQGNHLTWVSQTTSTYLYLLPAGATTAILVDSDETRQPYDLFWSPDGTQIIFNHPLNPGYNNIYGTTAQGASPVLLREGSLIHGWVEGGARILFQQGNTLFLALPDTTAPIIFYEGVGGTRPYPVIAPTGDRVLFNTSTGSQYVQATSGGAPIAVEFGDCYHVNQWQVDSSRVSCSAGRGDYAGFLGLKVGSSTNNPITPNVAALPAHLYPQFIGSQPYMATTHYRFRTAQGGYPVLDSPDSSFLFHLSTQSLKQIVYPNSEEFPVREWRYMP